MNSIDGTINNPYSYTISSGGSEYHYFANETNWLYTGSATYETDYDGYIKVDKGSPDKGRYVIFYAVKEEKDPMIFCKNKVELNKELKKLMKRENVDHKSIRIFAFNGGLKLKKK